MSLIILYICKYILYVLLAIYVSCLLIHILKLKSWVLTQNLERSIVSNIKFNSNNLKEIANRKAMNRYHLSYKLYVVITNVDNYLIDTIPYHPIFLCNIISSIW